MPPSFNARLACAKNSSVCSTADGPIGSDEGGAVNSSLAMRAISAVSDIGSQSGTVGAPGTRAPANATPGVGAPTCGVAEVVGA